jgi:hypothetical protein
VSLQAAHAGQVLPIVRYWMPHLRILSPEAWQAELEQGLAQYLGLADATGTPHDGGQAAPGSERGSGESSE